MTFYIILLNNNKSYKRIQLSNRLFNGWNNFFLIYLFVDPFFDIKDFVKDFMQ